MWKLKRAVGVFLTWGGAAGIAFATLTPAANVPASNVFCFLCGEFAVLDALNNLLLFAPLGAGLALLGAPALRAVATMALASVVIEALQVTVLPGRDANVTDVAANTLGGAMGFVFAPRARLFLRPAPRAARALFSAWLALWLVAQAAFSYAMLPAATAGRYFGQIRRSLGGRPPYDGRVLAATLNGEPMLDREYTRDASVRLASAIASPDGLSVDVLTQPRDTVDRMSSIVRLVDDRQYELLVLSADGPDIAFRARSGARVLRLRSLVFRLPRGLAAHRDSAGPIPVRLHARHAAATVQMSAHSARNSQALELRLTPGMGWRVLLPVSLSVSDQRRERVLAALWTMLVALPGGFWGAAAVGRPRPLVWLALALPVALVGHLAIPRATGLDSPVAHEIVASVLGFVLGARLLRRSPSS